MHIARATRLTLNNRDNSQSMVELIRFEIENAIVLDSARNSKPRTEARTEASGARKTEPAPSSSEVCTQTKKLCGKYG